MRIFWPFIAVSFFVVLSSMVGGEQRMAQRHPLFVIPYSITR
jgi:hypothetical protein